MDPATTRIALKIQLEDVDANLKTLPKASSDAIASGERAAFCALREELSSGTAWDKSCHCGISMAKGSLYEAYRLRANRWNKGATAISCIDRKLYGSLHEACRERMEQRWDETMVQAATRCTARKLPGSCRSSG